MSRDAARYRETHGRNPVLQGDGTAHVRLTRGQFAVIDAQDVPLVSQYTWTARPTWDGSGKFYACTYTSIKKRDPAIRMHRLIIQAEADQFVDHIDGDGLNNRRSNLRVATSSQNSANRNWRPNATTGVLGIRLLKSGRYRASVNSRDLTTEIGKTFDTLEEAKEWRKQATEDLFGDFYRESNQ